MYEQFGIKKEIENLSIKVENEIKEQFAEIDRICEINSMKVLKAFQDNGLSESHFNTSTGYGIDEPYRGHHYAAKACKLLFQQAKKHG